MQVKVQVILQYVILLFPEEYGIFISDPDPKHSFWLESSRLLSYYHLQDGVWTLDLVLFDRL